MADPNDSWHNKNFRQSVRTKIEEAIRQAGNPTAKTVPEMETHVFQKAHSKEEYLSLVARILIHIKDSKKNQGMVPGQVGPGPGGVPGGPPNVQGSDPMTALRSLASQGGNATLGGQGPPPHQMPGQIPGQLLVTGPPGGPMPNMGQPQQPGMSQNMPQGMPQGPGMIQTMGQPGMNPMVVQQTRFMSNVPQMTPQQQAQQAQQQAQHQAQQQHQQQMQQQQMQQQQQQQQQQHPHGPPMQRALLNPQMQVQRMRQQVPQQMHAGPGSPMVQQPSPAGQFQQPNQGPQFQCHSPVPAGLQMQNQGPGSNQPIPSPVQPLQNPGSLSRAQMTASPLGYAPSPSSQIVPSPVGAFQNRTPAGVPSPGSTLNTPATQIAPTPSPSNRSMQEDHMYIEKLKHLQKFVDPLRRMIMRMDKEEDKKKEQSRLKGLLDILTDPSKRCTMDVLLKCEQVLERMDMKYKAVSLPQPQMTSAPGMVKPQEQNIFQPLLDAIEKQIRTPLINHTLQRTFGPVIAALCGPSPRVPSPPPKRRKQEEDPNEIADVLQGEIARLDQRFKVQMDPIQHNGSKTVHLICQLEDKNLPCVPPINITVPENYPDRPPKCHIDQEEYESTPFLQSIKSVFSSHISSMPQKTSISCFLDTWEMSVRQACVPKTRPIAAI